MKYDWINAKDLSFNSFLLMDRWLIRMILKHYSGNDDFDYHLGIALKHHPAVVWTFKTRCPEWAERIDEYVEGAPDRMSEEAIRTSETYIIDQLETSVVYMYPQMMHEKCDYIYNWDKSKLLELADFKDKIVLDIGSGTGRLAFAAAEVAKRVYASEPTDRLREYLRDRIEREGISNMVVVDGTVESIPYEDETFDIVMSGHVVGDDYDVELREIERVVKNGGLVIDCIGDDNRTRSLNQELVSRGFDHFYHKSETGGDIYRYVKKVVK